MSKKGLATKMKKDWLRFEGKIRDILLLAVLGFILVFSAWELFHVEESQDVISMTEVEVKVARLLEEIEGVGDASVIVYENEGTKNVVVVCEGGRDLQVIMNVRAAVASALGTDEKSVKIYQKK